MHGQLRKIYYLYRFGTFGLRQKPEFLVIGAQKAGSTSLYEYLVQHPLISAAKTKEVQYFSNLFINGERWYRSNFPFLWRQGMTGEATPYYLFHPLAPKRIHNYNPAMKIIVVLREPVKRAISHYYHAVSHGFESREIAEAFTNEECMVKEEEKKLCADPTFQSFKHQELSYVSRGFYAKQLDRYAHLFNADNLLILRSEDLFEDPLQVLMQTFTFLQVDASFIPKDLKAKNTGHYGDRDPGGIENIVQYLRDVYRAPNIDLKTRYGVGFDQ